MRDWVYEKLGQLGDVAVLGLLILFFSLPIITIIPSLSAGIEIFHHKRKYGYISNITQTFFSYFKSILLKGVVCQIIIVFISCIGYLNIEIANTFANYKSVFIYAITIFFLFIAISTTLNFMFVIGGKDVLTTRELLKSSLLLVFVRFPLLIILLAYYFIFILITWIFPPILILTVCLICYLHYKLEFKIWEPIYKSL